MYEGSKLIIKISTIIATEADASIVRPIWALMNFMFGIIMLWEILRREFQ